MRPPSESAGVPEHALQNRVEAEPASRRPSLRLSKLVIVVCATITIGCSQTYIIVRDHAQALRQDAVPMTVTLKNGSRVESLRFFHTFGTTPDTLLAYAAAGDAFAPGVSAEEVARMTASAAVQRGGSADSGGATELLWCKGTHRRSDGSDTAWLGAIPRSDILAIELSDHRYIPLVKLQSHLSRRHRVTLHDGSVLVIDSAHFARDTTTLFLGSTLAERRIATPGIREMERVVSASGAAATAIGGGVAGWALFGLLPVLAWHAIGKPSGDESLAEFRIFLYGGIAGMVIVPWLGISSMEKTYVFLQ
jgi:hypothetical protein